MQGGRPVVPVVPLLLRTFHQVELAAAQGGTAGGGGGRQRASGWGMECTLRYRKGPV